MHPSKQKVIIWGFPLYSHSHSYVHQGWYKAFTHLGYDTYWFSDDSFPEDFDYTNALFITEGYADKNIPLSNTSTYFVHMCRNPGKYLGVGARLIDVRFNVSRTKDFTYDYVLDKGACEKLDECTFYERNASDSALRDKYRNNISGYEAVYTSWATDLLPGQIYTRTMRLPRERKIWYVGSIWSANQIEMNEFIRACKDAKVDFINRNPWGNLAKVHEHIDLIQKSYIAPDVRGSGVTCDEVTAYDCNHLDIGYIPCRTFKNISYGQVGATNSTAVRDLFNGAIIYNSSPYDLFSDTADNATNFSLIEYQMDYVKQHHTYVTRVESLLKIYNNK